MARINWGKRIWIADKEWNLLSKLADNAKMNWFYEEFYNRKTVTQECINDISFAFTSENIENLEDKEVFDLYEFFVRYNAVDPFMRHQLVKHFQNIG